MNIPDFRTAPRVLLVDDDVKQLGLRAELMMSLGFSVETADTPTTALLRVARDSVKVADVAVIDYNMPLLNGVLLASLLRSISPTLKIIIHSAALDIPEEDLSNVDAFVSKSEGVAPLLNKVWQLSGLHEARLLCTDSAA